MQPAFMDLTFNARVRAEANDAYLARRAEVPFAKADEFPAHKWIQSLRRSSSPSISRTTPPYTGRALRSPAAGRLLRRSNHRASVSPARTHQRSLSPFCELEETRQSMAETRLHMDAADYALTMHHTLAPEPFTSPAARSPTPTSLPRWSVPVATPRQSVRSEARGTRSSPCRVRQRSVGVSTVDESGAFAAADLSHVPVQDPKEEYLRLIIDDHGRAWFVSEGAEPVPVNATGAPGDQGSANKRRAPNNLGFVTRDDGPPRTDVSLPSSGKVSPSQQSPPAWNVDERVLQPVNAAASEAITSNPLEPTIPIERIVVAAAGQAVGDRAGTDVSIPASASVSPLRTVFQRSASITSVSPPNEISENVLITDRQRRFRRSASFFSARSPSSDARPGVELDTEDEILQSDAPVTRSPAASSTFHARGTEGQLLPQSQLASAIASHAEQQEAAAPAQGVVGRQRRKATAKSLLDAGAAHQHTAPPGFHRVARGESWEDLTVMYMLPSVDVLWRANPQFSSSKISLGMLLRIPEAELELLEL